MSDGRSAADWEALVSAHEQSGLSQVEFARRAGVGLGALQRSIRRVRERRAAGPSTGMQFLRVEVASGGRVDGAWLGQVEAALPLGVVLRFSQDADAEGIAGVIAATVRRLGC